MSRMKTTLCLLVACTYLDSRVVKKEITVSEVEIFQNSPLSTFGLREKE